MTCRLPFVTFSCDFELNLFIILEDKSLQLLAINYLINIKKYNLIPVKYIGVKIIIGSFAQFCKRHQLR